MACLDFSPADFLSGITDPGDDPSPLPSTISVTDATYYDVASPYVEFEITASPINYAAAVTFHYATANGTAIAGTNYTSASGTGTIPAGNSSVRIQVSVLKPAGVSGTKAFALVISSPTNATLGTPTSLNGTIDYSGGTVSDPSTLDSFILWPTSGGGVTVYNQFNPCTDKNKCTGFSVGTVTSMHEWLDTGAKTKFNPTKLFLDSHTSLTDCIRCTNTCQCSDSCVGWATSQTLAWAKSTGVQVDGGTRFRKIADWGQFGDTDKTTLLKKIKRNIYNKQGVILESVWFTAGHHCEASNGPDWNLYSLTGNPNAILPDPGSSATSCGGHSWAVIGWNNNIGGSGVGGFLIQNSFGTTYGKGGRVWMPYTALTTTSVRDATCADCSHVSHPWYRWFWASPKPGG